MGALECYRLPIRAISTFHPDYIDHLPRPLPSLLASASRYYHWVTTLIDALLDPAFRTVPLLPPLRYFSHTNTSAFMLAVSTTIRISKTYPK